MCLKKFNYLAIGSFEKSNGDIQLT